MYETVIFVVIVHLSHSLHLAPSIYFDYKYSLRFHLELSHSKCLNSEM